MADEVQQHGKVDGIKTKLALSVNENRWDDLEARLQSGAPLFLNNRFSVIGRRSVKHSAIIPAPAPSSRDKY